MRARAALAVAATLVLVSAATWYVLHARDIAASEHRAGIEGVSLRGPGLLYRETGDGRVALRVGATTRTSGLACARLYAAGGAALCLRPDPLAPHTFEAAVLDADLRVVRQIPLVGVPNRARVSASGRMLAWTVFVAGDSYNGGRFSTRAGILDTRTGALTGTLEDFTISVRGRPYHSADVNFWGITFASDDNRFYATMGTAGDRWLVEGDLRGRRIRALKENVECPSLSPDGTRIAYKKRVAGNSDRPWRLTVLRLETLTETPLAEGRGVDDQPAWQGDTDVLYALPRTSGRVTDVWSVPADGGGAPRLVLPEAESPAVL